MENGELKTSNFQFSILHYSEVIDENRNVECERNPCAPGAGC
jgi:hypothetical protein